MTEYEKRVVGRSWFRFALGLVARWRSCRQISKRIRLRRKAGAKIAGNVAIGADLRVYSPQNLEIGEHCSLQSGEISAQGRVTIGNHVVVGDNVTILTASHNIDSLEWELKSYGVEIDDYVWMATGATILPSCRHIGRGAVVGAKSVVVKDIPPMAVVSGNPAKVIRYRKCVHENLSVEALQGGDLAAYIEARKIKNGKDESHTH